MNKQKAQIQAAASIGPAPDQSVTDTLAELVALSCEAEE